MSAAPAKPPAGPEKIKVVVVEDQPGPSPPVPCRPEHQDQPRRDRVHDHQVVRRPRPEQPRQNPQPETEGLQG